MGSQVIQQMKVTYSICLHYSLLAFSIFISLTFFLSLFFFPSFWYIIFSFCKSYSLFTFFNLIFNSFFSTLFILVPSFLLFFSLFIWTPIFIFHFIHLFIHPSISQCCLRISNIHKINTDRTYLLLSIETMQRHTATTFFFSSSSFNVRTFVHCLVSIQWCHGNSDTVTNISKWHFKILPVINVNHFSLHKTRGT